MKRHTPIFAIVIGVALLAAAAPSQAIYIETALKLEPSQHEADVGDDVDFTIRTNPDVEDAKDYWADKTVKLRFSYDKNEGQQQNDPDAPTSNDGFTTRTIAELVLDADARGSFTWTVPAEVDARNVEVFLEGPDGDRLGFDYLLIGDAEPMMRITSAPGDMEPEPGQEFGHEDDAEDADAEEASALGLIALTLALGAVIAGVAVRRR